ncbi:hypothetical protein JCM10908_005127 [Rhodotorula pacifica]|uniref:GNAT family N-acetyltransferase n=1 Tax=Rhodotorula pacifica TaxID=1495444 RepID=UPI00316F80B2
MTTVVRPLEPSNYAAAADIQYEAFASDPLSGLIWGKVDPDALRKAHIDSYSRLATESSRTLRKAVRGRAGDGEEEIVGICVSAVIDTGDKREVKSDAPSAPGTDLDLLGQVHSMIGNLIEGYKKKDAKFAHLTMVVVSPRTQRTGAGAALLRKLIEDADAADLPCYLESSEAGEGLYRKYGFVECAERPRCGPDGILTVLPMRRPARAEVA